MKIRFLPFFSLFIFGLFSVLNASEQLYLSILAWKDDQVVRISQPVELEEDETLLRVGISEQLSESAVAEEGLEPFFGEGAVLKSFEVRNEKGIGIIEAPSLRESFVENEEIRKRFAWLLDEWIQFSIGIETAEIRLVNDSGLDLSIESETLLPVSKPEVDETEISERQVANVPHAPAQGTAQPTGALSDASIFLSPGHGWHYSSGRWRTQRGVTNQIIEVLNTAESVLQYLHQYLW